MGDDVSGSRLNERCRRPVICWACILGQPGAFNQVSTITSDPTNSQNSKVRSLRRGKRCAGGWMSNNTASQSLSSAVLY